MTSTDGRKLGLILATVVLLAWIGCSSETVDRSSSVDDGPARSATARLRDIEGSGVTGWATFTKAGNDRVRVRLEVDGASGRRAAHIHLRDCRKDSPVKDDLPDVMDGRSETVIRGSVQGLVGAGRSIAIHSTTDVSSPHLACGDIRRL